MKTCQAGGRIILIKRVHLKLSSYLQVSYMAIIIAFKLLRGLTQIISGDYLVDMG